MSALHWLSALCCALGLHSVLLFWQSPQTLPAAGSVGMGEQGLDSGYGLAGSYADRLNQTPPEPVSSEEPAPVEDVASDVEPVDVAEEPAPVAAASSEFIATPETPAVAEEAPNIPAADDQIALAGEAAQQKPPESLPEKTPSIDKAGHNRSASQPSQNSVRATGTATHAALGGKTVGDARSYFALLMAWLNQYKAYPAEAKKNKHQGVVSVQFTVNALGEVVSRHIKKSSGYALLDTAALAMFDAASPLPPIPDFMLRDQLTLVLPVEFSLITNNVFKE